MSEACITRDASHSATPMNCSVKLLGLLVALSAMDVNGAFPWGGELSLALALALSLSLYLSLFLFLSLPLSL